jgi:hypothetical protein
MRTAIVSGLLGVAGVGALLVATRAPARAPGSDPRASSAPCVIAKAIPARGTIAAATQARGETADPRVAPLAREGVRTMTVEPVVFAPWGSGPGELGHRVARESNPEGPMALVVDAAGWLVILDQVNARLARFDASGRALPAIPLPSETIQDVAQDPRGGYVLLDRLVERAVLFVDADGRPRGRVELEGRGVAEGGGVTGLFVGRDGTWVEYEHAALVRVALPSGEPDPERRVLDGRRTQGGTLVRAARDARGFAVVSVFGEPGRARAAPGTGAYLVKVDFGAPVTQLIDVAGTSAGQVLVVAQLETESTEAPYAVASRSIGLALLDRAGAPIARGELPPPEIPDEQLRPIALGPEGAVYQLHVGREGATIRRAR